MRLPSRLIVGWLCFATLMLAHAAEENPFSSLIAALSDDIASLQRQPTANSATSNRLTQERSALLALQRASAANLAPAQQTLQQLLASNLPPPLAKEVSTALQRVRTLYGKEAERLGKETDDALTRARNVVLKASHASELDACLIELRHLANASEPSWLAGSQSESPLRRLREAVHFVEQWQNYLWAVDSEKFDSGIKILIDLGQTDHNPFDVPRSELLSRTRSLEEKDKTQADNYVASILNNIHSLEDLPEALTQLKSRPPYKSQTLATVVFGLEAVCKAYLAFKEGVATTMPPTFWQTGDTNPVATRLRAELLLHVLPRILEVEQTDPPKPNETVETYLMRMRATAIANRDFELLSRTISTAREITSSIAGQGRNLVGQDYMSFLAWREGLNDEQAKRFFEAAVAYRRALNSATPAVPVEFIAERLDAIEKEHPDEFKQAADVFGRHDGGIIPRPYGTPAGLKVPAVSQRPTPSRTPTPTVSPMPWQNRGIK